MLLVLAYCKRTAVPDFPQIEDRFQKLLDILWFRSNIPARHRIQWLLSDICYSLGCECIASARPPCSRIVRPLPFPWMTSVDFSAVSRLATSALTSSFVFVFTTRLPKFCLFHSMSAIRSTSRPTAIEKSVYKPSKQGTKSCLPHFFRRKL